MVIDFIQLEIGVNPRADRADHGADLFVFKDLRQLFLFDVERFSAQGKNGLELTDARLFRRTACRIPLHDKHFVEFGFSPRTRGKLPD